MTVLVTTNQVFQNHLEGMQVCAIRNEYYPASERAPCGSCGVLSPASQAASACHLTAQPV